MASFMPTEDYSTKEKFILACCVSRSGDQNWVSVSRTMKLITEACGDGENRPTEWFSQKNCATKYNQLLNTAFATKRKVRGQNSDSINIETPAEQVLRKLTFKRIEELDQAIKAERERYKKLKSDIEKIQGGLIDDQLPQIWNAIQRGDTLLEDVIKSEPVETPTPKPPTHTITSVPSVVPIQVLPPSRPQRATKETEKFKSYIEQRQKHNAKYHHHSSSSSSTTTSSASSSASSSTATSAAHTPMVSPDVSAIIQPMAGGSSTLPTVGLNPSLSDISIPYEPNVVAPSKEDLSFLQEVEQQPKIKQRTDSQQKLQQQMLLQQQNQDQQQQLLLLQRQQQLQQLPQLQQAQQQLRQQQQQQQLKQQQLQQQQQELLKLQQEEEEKLEAERQLEQAQLHQQQLELQKKQEEEELQMKVQQEFLRQQQEEHERMEQLKLEEQQRQEEKLRREEQLRLEEQQRLAEEQRIQELKRQEELQRQKEMQRQEELQRLQEQRLAEQRRIEEEQRLAEIRRQEEEQQLLEQQAQLAALQKLEEEEAAAVELRMEEERRLQQEREEQLRALEAEKAQQRADEEEAKQQEQELLEKLQEEEQLQKQQSQKRTQLLQPSVDRTEQIENPAVLLDEDEELERQKLLQKQQQLEQEYKQQLQLHQKQQQQKLQKKHLQKQQKLKDKNKKLEDDEDEGKVEAKEELNTVRPGDISSTSLSSLLTVPTQEIKAHVEQISEVLKEPIKNPHHVTKEAYEAYKSVQLPSPTTQAPVLSKLLESTTSPQQQAACKTSSQVAHATRSKKSPLPPQQATLPPQQSSITQFFGVVSDDDKTKTYPLFSPDPSDSESPSGETKHFPTVDSELYTNLFSSTESTPSNETFNITSPIKAIVEKRSPHNTPFNPPPLDKGNSSGSVNPAIKTQLFPPGMDSAYEEKRPPEHSLTVDVGEQSGLGVEVDDEGGDKQSSGTLLEVAPAKRTLDSYGSTHVSAAVDATSPHIFGGHIAQKTMPPSAKKKKAGRRSKKKENPMKIDILDAVKALELGMVSDEERKQKTPLTPGGEPSPASPALSTGSNCGDPETAHQQRAWRKSIMLVWKAAASHKFANIFLHSVTDEEAPGYSSIIFRPMDLSLIKKNIETGVITTTAEFQRDIMLMFQNALMYNRREHDVYQMANEMRKDVMEQIQSYISAQVMVQSTDRDAKAAGHTRHSSKPNFSFLSL